MRLFDTEKYHSLEEALGRLRHVDLATPKKSQMRSRLLASLQSENFGLEPLVNSIRARALEVQPSPSFRTILREKLRTLVDFEALRSGRGGIQRMVEAAACQSRPS